MNIQHSVTLWIDQLREGDSIAAERLWEEYFQRMLEVARHKLKGAKRTAADEEDVALSAFKSFCVGARNGRFGQLTDRTNLWPLLVAITANKAVDLIRYENREKRGGPGRAERPSFDRDQAVALGEVLSPEPTPEFAAQLAEEFENLLSKLGEARDADLQRIALWRMDGESNDEIAVRLNCARRTVERKLRVIATLWGREADS
jgi:DNA-directed RNA polymerase specialized sigma24 family protein